MIDKFSVSSVRLTNANKFSEIMWKARVPFDIYKFVQKAFNLP